MSHKTEKLIQLRMSSQSSVRKVHSSRMHSYFICMSLIASPLKSQVVRDTCTDELLRTVLKIKDDIKALQADEANTQ